MTIHVCGAICGDELREVSRRQDGEERWCFKCRKRRTFERIVMAPVGMSYYGPSTSIKCAACGLEDGDMFPGTWREWDD